MGGTTPALAQGLRVEKVLNSDSHDENATPARLVWRTFAFVSTELSNDNLYLYLARYFVVACRWLQALRVQTLDIDGDRGGLQAPVQRATNKPAGGADILTRQTARQTVS
jgi:hypothetical protein